MHRDATACKCFVQLVGNRKLVGDKALERPSLPASELVSFQNYAGLRGRTRAGRPYPAFLGMRKSSTCSFDFANYGMLGGSRPGPVNRYGFEIAGQAGARLAPIKGLAPAGWPLSEWRPAPRKRKTADGWTRDVPRALERRAAAMPPPAGRAPRAGRASRGFAARSRVRIRGRGGESFSKNVLASPSEFPYSTSSHGGVAQLGERLTGSQEVRGSIPLVSTRALNEAPTQVGAFFHIGTQGQRRQHDPPGRQDRALNGSRVHGSISRRGSKRWSCSATPTASATL